jgi:hypothetical protein
VAGTNRARTFTSPAMRTPQASANGQFPAQHGEYEIGRAVQVGVCPRGAARVGTDSSVVRLDHDQLSAGTDLDGDGWVVRRRIRQTADGEHEPVTAEGVVALGRRHQRGPPRAQRMQHGDAVGWAAIEAG